MTELLIGALIGSLATLILASSIRVQGRNEALTAMLEDVVASRAERDHARHQRDRALADLEAARAEARRARDELALERDRHRAAPAS